MTQIEQLTDEQVAKLRVRAAPVIIGASMAMRQEAEQYMKLEPELRNRFINAVTMPVTLAALMTFLPLLAHYCRAEVEAYTGALESEEKPDAE